MNCPFGAKANFRIFTIIGSFGLGFFYIRVWINSTKIKKLNIEIEKNKEKLNCLEIDSIESDDNNFTNFDFSDNKNEKQQKRKVEQKIEKLERKKQYLLEEISIYKLFKK